MLGHEAGVRALDDGDDAARAVALLEGADAASNKPNLVIGGLRLFLARHSSTRSLATIRSQGFPEALHAGRAQRRHRLL
jgi:hypothetical protein